MLNKPAEDDEQEEQEEKAPEEQPEIIEDDLIKTPGKHIIIGKAKLTILVYHIVCMYNYTYADPQSSEAGTIGSQVGAVCVL